MNAPLRHTCALLGLLLVALALPAAASAAPLAPLRVDTVAFAPERHTALEVDVTRTRSARRAPIVVLIHGGGWARGDRREWDANGWTRVLARSGFVVFNVNYRLACMPMPPARGRARFVQVPRDERLCGGRMEDAIGDVREAISWTTRNGRRYGGDTRRIALMGASSGAHLALVMASQPDSPRAVRAVAAISPISNLQWFRARRTLTPRLDTSIGCTYSRCPGRWLAVSPFHMLHRGATPPPTYLFASRRDSYTPFIQSLQYANALRRDGARVVLREPTNRASGCHGPWSCDRYVVKGGKQTLRPDIVRWLRVELARSPAMRRR